MNAAHTPFPLAEAFAAMHHSCAQLPPAQAVAIALLLRLLAALEALAHAWKPAPRPRRRYRGGKGPQFRDWMIPCHPTRKHHPSPPRSPQSPHARKPRAPPASASPDSACGASARSRAALPPAISI